MSGTLINSQRDEHASIADIIRRVSGRSAGLAAARQHAHIDGCSRCLRLYKVLCNNTLCKRIFRQFRESVSDEALRRWTATLNSFEVAPKHDLLSFDNGSANIWLEERKDGGLVLGIKGLCEPGQLTVLMLVGASSDVGWRRFFVQQEDSAEHLTRFVVPKASDVVAVLGGVDSTLLEEEDLDDLGASLRDLEDVAGREALQRLLFDVCLSKPSLRASFEVAAEMSRNAAEYPSAAVSLQRELTDFIRLENIRLNRLIINLYLKFTLAPHPDEDVFYSVCHSIAEYFHADACELLLVHREEEGQLSDEVRASLRLYGAFGAWQRALASPYVRHRQPIGYAIPVQVDFDTLGNTLGFLFATEPESIPHRGLFRSGHDRTYRARTKGDYEDVPHQEAWLNADLATTCRNMLGTSLRRPRQSGDRKFGDGVIMVENRRPWYLTAFRSGYEQELFLRPIWRSVAVRPYLRYLAKNPPLHESMLNDVGWQRRYEELEDRIQLFWDFRAWYAADRQIEVCAEKAAKARDIKGSLDNLLFFVTTAETFLQHLQAALQYLFQVESAVGGMDGGLAHHVRSYLNIANVCNIWNWLETQGVDYSWVTRDRQALQQGLLPVDWIAIDEVHDKNDVRRAVNQVSDILLKELGWISGSTDDFESVLAGSLEQDESALNYFKASAVIRNTLYSVCTRLIQFRPFASAIPRPLAREYQRLRSWAEVVLRKLETFRLPHDGAFSMLEPGNGLDLQATVRACLLDLANVVNTVAMDAHTFTETDEARLLFVSRRVDQLLDNRIIALAQARNIPLGHDDVTQLRIDEFALECLERILLEAQAIIELVKRIFLLWAGRYLPDQPLPTLLCGRPDLRRCFQQLKSCISNGGEARGQEPYQLLWVSVRPKLVNEAALLEVLERAAETAETIKFMKGALGDETAVILQITLPHEYSDSSWLLAVANDLSETRLRLERRTREAEQGEAPATCLGQPERRTPRSDVGTGHQGGSCDEWTQHLRMLRKELDSVILDVGRTSRKALDLAEPWDFLDLLDGWPPDGTSGEQLGGHLSRLCEAIAAIVRCDSCALFFGPVDESIETGRRRMRMRAASGRLRKTLEAWREAREHNGGVYAVKGVEYVSRWTAEIAQCVANATGNGSSSREKLEEMMRDDAGGHKNRWPLTNQMWHTGEGRIANSREEFQHASLRSLSDRGLGDRYAYPPDGQSVVEDREWSLRNVFRTFIGIPIFARGGRTEYVPHPDDPWWWWPNRETPDAARTEFHNAYRVVGILKLEGKRPDPERLSGGQWWQNLRRESQEKFRVVLQETDERKLVADATTLLDTLYYKDEINTDVGRRLLATSSGSVDDEFVDDLTQALNACWQPEDVELLVAIAMDVGRLLTVHTLHQATDYGIVIGENEVGLLDIRPSDVWDIVLADTAAERVCAKVEHELHKIQMALEREQLKTMRIGRRNQPDEHKTIISIGSRKKDYMSLFRKLVRKEFLHSRTGVLRLPSEHAKSVKSGVVDEECGVDKLPDEIIESAKSAETSNSHRVPLFKGSILDMNDWSPLSSPERLVHGDVTLLVKRDDGQQTSVELLRGDLRVGSEGISICGSGETESGAGPVSFVYRVLSRSGYKLADWAGVRVVCSFLSDVDQLLDAIRTWFPEAAIVLDEHDIECWLERAQADGYRGVHLNVRVPLKGLLSDEQHEQLLRVLKLNGASKEGLVGSHPDYPDMEVVYFPCEIQIHTAYQHSWSIASHQIRYKREDVRDDLGEHMGSLSGLLYEADKIMDVVREIIEVDDTKHSQLMRYLRLRLPDTAFAVVHFAAELARDFHKNDVLYGGQPRYTHLLHAANTLVRCFSIDDPYMLSLAFFQDLWMSDASEAVAALDGGTPIMALLRDKIDRYLACEVDEFGLVQRLRRRLPDQWPACELRKDASATFGRIPKWFSQLLEIGLRSWCEPDDRQSRYRLEQYALKKNIDLVAHRGYVLETAMQISRLSELPNDPHRPRAVKELEAIYHLLERIRRSVGEVMRPVLREAERALRETADKLDAYLPIEWEA